MTITAQQIINRVQEILIDETNLKFDTDELLLWSSDAQRQVVLAHPPAGATVATFAVTQDQSMQALPAGGISVLDVICNGTEAAPGDVITVAPRGVLNAKARDWTQSTAAAVIQHFALDDRFPTKFFVYPRPATGFNILIAYSLSPAELTDVTDPLTIPDIYAGPILDWVMYRALSKIGSEALGDPTLGIPALAAQYHSAFYTAMGVKANVDISVSPNQSSWPHNQSMPPMSGAAGR